MGAQANLVLNNGAVAPIAKTFTPLQPYGGKDRPAVWMLKEGTSPLGHIRIEVSMTRNGNGTTRVTPKVIVPYVTNDPVAGPRLVSKCIYDAAGGGFIIPENAIQSQIDDMYAFSSNLTSNAMFALWVKSLEPAF